MKKTRAEQLEEIEARQGRALWWLTAGFGFFVAAIVSLAAGVPGVVSLLLIAAGFAAGGVAARDLVPVFGRIRRLWRRRQEEDGE